MDFDGKDPLLVAYNDPEGTVFLDMHYRTHMAFPGKTMRKKPSSCWSGQIQHGIDHADERAKCYH
jgi:hypothetical protein